MEKKKILYVTSEIFPYLPEGYISNIGRYLPQGVQERKNEIRTFMPKFGCVNDHRHMLHEVIRLSGQNIIIEDTDHPLIIKVASLQSVRMQIYFIDSEDFFKRKSTYFDENNVFYPDNDSRTIFYAKGVIETVRKLGWDPDIIHCIGWISALVPLFIKTVYKDDPLFQNSKLVYSIMPDAFTEKFPTNFKKKLQQTNIPTANLNHFRNPGYDQLIQTAIDYSDAVCITPGTGKRLLNYIEKQEKLTLHHPEDDNYVDLYDEFYDQLIETDKTAQ
ncbi:MAG: glycogen/starch synthase [Bacteroidales bacterium]|nr:glycogen/starch synthase [Bacteroidales bacterium]